MMTEDAMYLAGASDRQFIGQLMITASSQDNRRIGELELSIQQR